MARFFQPVYFQDKLVYDFLNTKLNFEEQQLSKETQPVPFFMKTEVLVFKLITPSIRGYFDKNALLHEMSIG
jgi:hypothetical protein